MIIAIDFDGTIVEHKYPYIGEPIPNAIDCINKIINNGHKIILYTMRSDKYLLEAVKYCEENNIRLWCINKNIEQNEWTNSPKVYAHYYIDDAAIGCPLIHPYGLNKRPYVDWFKVEEILKNINII